MKLWHVYSLSTLPDKLLAALHRDVCNWRSHPRSVDRKYPWLMADTIWWYHRQVMAEMERRGWKPEHSWHSGRYRGRSLSPIPRWLCPTMPPDHTILGMYYESNPPSALQEDMEKIRNWEARNESVQSSGAKATA